MIGSLTAFYMKDHVKFSCSLLTRLLFKYVVAYISTLVPFKSGLLFPIQFQHYQYSQNYLYLPFWNDLKTQRTIFHCCTDFAAKKLKELAFLFSRKRECIAIFEKSNYIFLMNLDFPE